jgi:membrane glycosyltransferase
MSYLASPLWLALLLAGLGLAAIAYYETPNYFPDGFSLFPAWPVFDPELALRLLAVTAVVLYLPKLLGVILAMADGPLRRGCGGVTGLIKSVLAETVLSMLLSPVMMLIQSRFVADVFLGRDSGWNSQNREDQAMPFAVVAQRHIGHVIFGNVIAVASALAGLTTFLWFVPIIVGLIASPVVSWATGIPELGRWLYDRNIFRIPEEEVELSGKRLENRHESEPYREAAE